MLQYQIGSMAKNSLLKKDIEDIVHLKIIDKSNTFLFINGVATLSGVYPNRLYFVERISDEVIFLINNKVFDSCLLLLSNDFSQLVNTPHIICENPRDYYSRIVNKLFNYMSSEWNDLYEVKVFGTSFVAPNCCISKTAKIGNGCIIFPGVYIGPNCRIGDHVIIKSNTIIGQPGFGVYKDSELNNKHLPHVGGVIVNDNVEIGALNTIASGTINPTVIDNFVKTDDHVHIAHNCFIGSNTMIAAHAEISGSVTIGKNVWIGPNVSIVNSIEIGDHAFLGIGANVWKNVAENSRILGLPSRKQPF
jgi:UDP-3-O-[3-hydroxymyristoyl] glucosamine N-acyltransferase LpxD